MTQATNCTDCRHPYVCLRFGCRIDALGADRTYKAVMSIEQGDAPTGCQPLRHLTEADVRRIVREELAAAASLGAEADAQKGGA